MDSDSRPPYPSAQTVDDPEVGDLVRNVTFQGYLSGSRLVSDGDWTSFSLGELRKRAAEYLIVNVSSIWCGPCLLGAETMAKRKEEAEAAGAFLIELVLDGPSAGVDPTLEELDAWIESAELTIATARAGDDDVRRVFSEREHAYVIDLDTMRVVWKAAGFYSNTTVADEAIDALLDHRSGSD